LFKTSVAERLIRDFKKGQWAYDFSFTFVSPSTYLSQAKTFNPYLITEAKALKHKLDHSLFNIFRTLKQIVLSNIENLDYEEVS